MGLGGSWGMGMRVGRGFSRLGNLNLVVFSVWLARSCNSSNNSSKSSSRRVAWERGGWGM